MPNIKYDSIPHDAIIEIKLSGHFYEQLKISLMSLCEKMEPQALLEMMERFKVPGPVNDANEHNIQTLLRLIRDIEIKAKEQGMTKEQEMVNPEDPS